MENNNAMNGSIGLRMNKGETALYFIKDSVSDVRVSGFMEFPTEAHACMSFCQFIDEQKFKTKIENIDCYKLILAAKIGVDDVLSETDNIIICDGSDCVKIRDLYIDGYKKFYEV